MNISSRSLSMPSSARVPHTCLTAHHPQPGPPPLPLGLPLLCVPCYEPPWAWPSFAVAEP